MAQTNFERALAAHQAGRWDEAEGIYKDVLVSDASNADAWHLLGLVHHQRGNDAEAAGFIERALALAPRVGNFHNSMGLVRHRLGDFEEAEQQFLAAMTLGPADADAPNNLGLLLTDLRRYGEAENYFRRSLTLRPDYAGARHNLSRALVRLGRPEEALGMSEAACALAPDNADFVNCHGIVLRELGDRDGAVSRFRHAIEIDENCAEAHVGLAHELLSRGEFTEGWAEHEWRLKRPEHAVWPAARRWDGGDLSGKSILLWAEQGYGDAIQFVRYVSCIREKGAKEIILAVRPALRRLLSNMDGVTKVVSDGENVTFDVHCPMMSLPYHCYKEFGVLDGDVPYIRAKRSGQIPAHAKNRVGLVWAGNPGHANDRNRSIKLKNLAPLFERPDCEFRSLQMGTAARELEPPVNDATGHIEDFADTAEILASMDLIIAVDTSVAHLAGAMGRPVWVLLPPVPDWRWLMSYEESRWYPSMRLFRRADSEDWSAVIARLKVALDLFVKQKSGA